MSPFYNETSTFDTVLEYYADDRVANITYYEVIMYGESSYITGTDSNTGGPTPWIRMTASVTTQLATQLVMKVYGFLVTEEN